MRAKKDWFKTLCRWYPKLAGIAHVPVAVARNTKDVVLNNTSLHLPQSQNYFPKTLQHLDTLPVFAIDKILSTWYYYFCLVKTGDYVDDRYIKVITGEEPSGGLVHAPSHFLYASIRFNN